jgi:hypothetical protein
MALWIWIQILIQIELKCWIWIRNELKCWIRIRIRIDFNLDPQPWLLLLQTCCVPAGGGGRIPGSGRSATRRGSMPAFTIRARTLLSKERLSSRRTTALIRSELVEASRGVSRSMAPAATIWSYKIKKEKEFYNALVVKHTKSINVKFCRGGYSCPQFAHPSKTFVESHFHFCVKATQ